MDRCNGPCYLTEITLKTAFNTIQSNNQPLNGDHILHITALSQTNPVFLRFCITSLLKTL